MLKFLSDKNMNIWNEGNNGLRLQININQSNKMSI